LSFPVARPGCEGSIVDGNRGVGIIGREIQKKRRAGPPAKVILHLNGKKGDGSGQNRLFSNSCYPGGPRRKPTFRMTPPMQTPRGVCGVDERGQVGGGVLPADFENQRKRLAGKTGELVGPVGNRHSGFAETVFPRPKKNRFGGKKTDLPHARIGGTHRKANTDRRNLAFRNCRQKTDWKSFTLGIDFQLGNRG